MPLNIERKQKVAQSKLGGSVRVQWSCGVIWLMERVVGHGDGWPTLAKKIRLTDRPTRCRNGLSNVHSAANGVKCLSFVAAQKSFVFGSISCPLGRAYRPRLPHNAPNDHKLDIRPFLFLLPKHAHTYHFPLYIEIDRSNDQHLISNQLSHYTQ